MSDDDAVDAESAEDEAGDAARTNGTAEATAEEAAAESADGDARHDDEALAAAVAEHDEALAREVAALEADLAETREALRERDEEVDELTSKLARVKADFSNYKERAKRKQEEIRERASEALVERIAPVRNDLLRALDQDEGSDLRPGVESTLEKFDDVLADEGVEPIEPEPGEEVDPARHQVMLRVDSDRPEGTIHEVYEPGYEMGDRVLSEAKVTVSTGDGE
ncbi:nucleotide exchange factor GrpE [Halorubrum sp. Atlit-8R]|uniref:nucleotide exchange factor GrpE n=1 Tax=unclassified Halorubrum TaxID=2642239 RepID=UPI000EF19E7E|nr:MULTISPECIES: nucleotide exchange factor GrpE [unclassified Halorubrum]RLM63523.1 nucleotide exchange factor GrpE [Halorubrum sp. Atlit-9R]RLM76999.1 nucleotide exchange factor GrpE [Halorubrum sp. Atlit-8R]